MFEQSIILPPHTHKHWTFAASIFMEVTAVGVLLLIPLIYTEAIGRAQVGLPRIAPPITMFIPKPQLQLATSSSPIVRRSQFYPPPKFQPLDQVIHALEPESAPVVETCPNCVAANFPSDKFVGAIGVPNGELTPPPPPKPTETKKLTVEPPAVKLAQPIQVSRGVQEAMILHRVIPQYPPLARQVRVSGTVKLMSVINKEGTIERLEVLSGHPLLVAAAVEAVKQWRYRPTMLNGQPVEVVAPIEVHFLLSN